MTQDEMIKRSPQLNEFCELHFNVKGCNCPANVQHICTMKAPVGIITFKDMSEYNRLLNEAVEKEQKDV